MIKKYDIAFDEYGNKQSDVDVSVFCLTYNHIQFIRKTLEGFLKQRTNFKFYVYIFDDASTDGTSDIVIEYAKKYPDLFYVLIPRKNTYRHEHRMEILYSLIDENLTGKYSAWCEGDDYWIYGNKLQKQYDYMEQHVEISLCMHNAIRYDQKNNEVIPQIADMESGYVDKEEIVFCLHGRVPTASYFWRTELVKFSTDYFYSAPVTDDPLRVWLGYKGNVYYMDKVWVVRNYMHEASWNHIIVSNILEKRQHCQSMLRYMLILKNEMEDYYQYQIEKWIGDMCQILLESYFISPINEKDFMSEVEKQKEAFNYQLNEYFDLIAHILKRNCIDTMKILRAITFNTEKHLYIYGAGVLAKKAVRFLEENEIIIEAFVTSSGGIGMYEGYEVSSIDDINEDSNEVYFYIATGFNYRDEIVENLRSRGFYNYF